VFFFSRLSPSFFVFGEASFRYLRDLEFVDGVFPGVFDVLGGSSARLLGVSSEGFLPLDSSLQCVFGLAISAPARLCSPTLSLGVCVECVFPAGSSGFENVRVSVDSHIFVASPVSFEYGAIPAFRRFVLLDRLRFV